VARGATGRNAGQLTTYFERPLVSIADEFGEDLAVDGQRTFDDAHGLLDLIAREAAATVRIDRFTGHMGMYNGNHVLVHLRNNAVRRRGGLREETCLIAETAEFLRDIPPQLRDLYTVVKPSVIADLLETQDDRYQAVLSDLKGCANSGLLAQQVLAYLEARFPGRLEYRDSSPVERVVVADDAVRLLALDRVITAERVVLCTNGFVEHVVEDAAGVPLELHPDQRVVGTIGFMAAFFEEHPRAPAAFSYIRNVEIGGATPYVYVTRRTYERAGSTATLTCMGGPEWPIEPPWDPLMAFPGPLLSTMDDEVRPFAQPARPPGLPYDFQWHGLMGYTNGRIRVIGAHPAQPRLLYNLGCNGVGFLPSVAGGERIARLLAGERLAPSIFDPRAANG
jgi:glycine/D-amino acid oxidase-like deaminating enzyme